MEKKCSKCKRMKSQEEFSKNRTKKDGLMDACKPCRQEMDRQLRSAKRQKNITSQPASVGQKTCSRCRQEKPLAEFVRDNSRSDGFGHRCKPCQKDYHAEWRNSSSSYKTYQADYYERNKEYINARNRAYYEANKEWLLPLMNERRFEKKYRITRAEAADLLADQDGCAICHTHEPGKNGWCVDHDHDTDEVRGILCGKCNSGIAFLGDTREGISKALTYLS